MDLFLNLLIGILSGIIANRIYDWLRNSESLGDNFTPDKPRQFLMQIKTVANSGTSIASSDALWMVILVWIGLWYRYKEFFVPYTYGVVGIGTAISIGILIYNVRHHLPSTSAIPRVIFWLWCGFIVWLTLTFDNQSSFEQTQFPILLETIDKFLEPLVLLIVYFVLFNSLLEGIAPFYLGWRVVQGYSPTDIFSRFFIRTIETRHWATVALIIATLLGSGYFWVMMKPLL